MENGNMNEKAFVIDEQLDNISGGIDPSYILKARCTMCQREVSKLDIVNYNNRAVCKACMEKFGNR